MSFFVAFWVFTGIAVYEYLPKSSAAGFYHFIFTEILIGFIAPVLFIIGVTIILLVIQYITNYDYRAETFVPGILSIISFKRSEEYCFWVIAKYFYFRVDKKNVAKKGGNKQNWCQRKLNINVSSWCISTILAINVMLSATFVIDSLLIQSYKSDQCNDESTEYNCFTHDTHMYINCSENISHVADIDCYKFVSFNDLYTTDPLNMIIQAVFMFLAAEKILSTLFNTVKSLMSFYCSKIWAVIATGFGFILTLIGITTLVVYYTIHQVGFAFLSVVQFTMLSFNVMLGGFLLVIGSPMQVVPNKGKANVLQSVNSSTAIKASIF